jgi:hypothetical protein
MKLPARRVLPYLIAPLIFVTMSAGPAVFISAQSASGWNAPLRYEIRVELDNAKKMLSGHEDIVWQNTSSDPVPDMLFHLYWNAFKNENSTVMEESRQGGNLRGIEVKDGDWGWIDVTSIQLADGRDLLPSRTFVSADEPRHEGDQTVMRVVFPEPINPGESVSLKLEFQSKVPKTVLRSGYYQNSYFIGQWFPKPGVYEEGKGWNCHAYHVSSEFFADFGDFKVQITVPENFVVGSSGKQTASAPDAAQKTVTYTFEQERIHDFAWTASPNFIKVERDFVADKEVTPQEYEDVAKLLGLSVEEVKLPNVKMILLIGKQHEKQIDRHFKALRMALKYYGLWYGPYPYETVTMIDPPYRTKSGGMEYPTLFTAGTSYFPAKDVLSPEGVIVHEFGHGYWYGLAANNEFEEAWLDEGINTYSTGKVMAQAYGPGAMSFVYNGIPLNWLISLTKASDFQLDRAAAINIVTYDPVVTPSWMFYSDASYSLNVYMRAATTLNTLERLLGRETWARVMRTFHTRFRFRHPTTRDFAAVVDEISGMDMTWFFDEFFFNTLNFDYGIASLRSAEKLESFRGVFDTGGKKEEVTTKKIDELKAKDKPAKGAKEAAAAKKTIYVTELTLRRFGEAKIQSDTPLKVKVVFDDGSEEVRTWDGQSRWMKMTFEKPAKATMAILDPDVIWLIDSNLANNSYQVKIAKGSLFRLAAKLLFLAQNILQAVSGLM